jgi:hypothetical protein
MVNATRVSVTIGETDLSATLPRAIAQSRVVLNGKQWKIHEYFNASTGVNDIALIHLPLNVVQNSNTSIGYLYFYDQSTTTNFNSYYTNKIATVAGWGRTRWNATSLPWKLQYANNLKVINTTECQKTWPKVTANQICVVPANTTNKQVI